MMRLGRINGSNQQCSLCQDKATSRRCKFNRSVVTGFDLLRLFPLPAFVWCGRHWMTHRGSTCRRSAGSLARHRQKIRPLGTEARGTEVCSLVKQHLFELCVALRCVAFSFFAIWHHLQHDFLIAKQSVEMVIEGSDAVIHHAKACESARLKAEYLCSATGPSRLCCLEVPSC